MRWGNVVVVLFVASVVALAGCGKPKCEYPGCTQPGNHVVEYGNKLGDAQIKRVEIHLCDEHYGTQPATWPGEFHKEGLKERIARQKAEAEKMREKQAADEAKRAEAEKSLLEDVLYRNNAGDVLLFKPKFDPQPAKDSVVALVFSHPGTPQPDAEKLKREEIRLGGGGLDQLHRGLSLHRRGDDRSLAVTLVVPGEKPITDRQLDSYAPDDLKVEEPAVAEQPRTPARPGAISGAVAEFTRDGDTLRFVRFLTPVCEAKPMPKPE